MSKKPYMPFYIGDYKKDITVQSLDRYERNIWLDLMCLMWESSERGYLTINGKPMSHEAIARAIGEDNQNFKICLTKILDNGCFNVREDGAIFSRRMVRESEISVKRSISGSQGGNPNLLKQNSSKPSSKTQASSDIDIDNDNVIDLNILKEDPKAAKAVNRWIEHRRKINKPLDQMAVDSLIMLYAGRYNDLPDDIDHSISNGWKTLNAKPKQPSPKVFKPPEPAVRRTINNYVPPTPEEKKRLTPEQVAANRKLIEEKLGKIKGVS